MADVQVTSATLENGTLTVSGSGFTRTTTTVTVDGTEMPFTLNDDSTELTIHEVPAGASEIEVTKGEITAEANIESAEGQDSTAGQSTAGETASSAPAPENPYPAQPTEDDELADATPGQLAGAANAGAEAKQDPNAPDRTPLEPGQALPGADFRTKVENTAAGDLNWDPREPYPVGNPPSERESFHRMHGYYKAEDDETSPGGTP